MSGKSIKLSNNTSLEIEDFKLESFCANPTICMIGKRGTGKSYICRDIIKHFSFLPGGLVISKTEQMSCFFGDFFLDTYIHYEYKSEILENLFSRQKQIIEKCKSKYKEGKKVDPRVFLVMDDCLASKGTWMNDAPILEVFYNGRHFQILFILTMQFPLGIRPELRGNFDYIFLLADDFYSNQKRLYDHYAGMFPSFDIFRQVFIQLTDDYGCMVIANRGSKKNIQDKIFHFKASNEPCKQIGCSQFKKFHDDNYNKNWIMDKETGFDMTKYDKKSKAHINVSKITR
jgi:hypothetical protein